MSLKIVIFFCQSLFIFHSFIYIRRNINNITLADFKTQYQK